MQPYQEASEAIQKRREAPGQFLKKAAIAAPSILGGGAIINRIMPLLNEFIPPNIASKGLEKIDSRFGKFIQGAIGNGSTMDEVMSFIKEKVGGAQEKQQAPNQQSIIEQYSPELFQFLTGEIQKGRQPIEAGALAETSGKFKKAIADMVKDHKAPFSSILESVFGGGQMAQKQPQQQPQQTQQPQQGQGNNDQALMAALQKILSM